MVLLIGFIAMSCISLKTRMSVKTYWQLIFFILLINVIQTVRGYVTYGSIAYFDAKLVVVYYLMNAVLIYFMNVNIVKRIEKAIIIATLIIGIYFLYIFSISIGLVPNIIGDFLQQGYEIFGSGWRRNSGYHITMLCFTLPFVIILASQKTGNNKLNWFAIILAGISVLISMRRGIILSAIIGTTTTLLFLPSFRKGKIAYLLLTSITIFSLLIFYFNITGYNPSSYWDVILSSFDFQTNSNYTRAIQYDFLISQIKLKPLFGFGIGANNPGIIRSFENVSAFELGYIAMIYKIGIIGFSLNLILSIWGFNRAIKIAKTSKSHANHIAPALAGWISMLVYHSTNPIFSTFSNLFFYFYLFYLINIFSSIKKLSYSKIR